MRNFLLIILLHVSFSSSAQWLQLTADTEYFHEAVWFHSNSKGIVAGWNGVYQRTYDGGITWDTANIQLDDWSLCTRSPYGSDLNCIFFPSDSVGYIGGQDGDLFKTYDGGDSWHCISCTNCWDNLEDLYFFNNDTGIATSNFLIQRTTDGGVTWSYTQLSYDVSRIAPVNDSTLLVAGQKILRSTDYGATWFPVNSDTTVFFNDISMGDTLHGLAVSHSGKVSRTTDGGLNWSTPQYISLEWITNVEMRNDSFAVITLGDDPWPYQPNDVTYVWYTLDGGLTWTQPAPLGTKTMTDLHMISDSTAYVCGWRGHVMKNDHLLHPLITGQEENADGQSLVLFPDPASEVIFVSLPGAMQNGTVVMHVTDVSGRTVITQQTANIATDQIDISSLTPGVYFLHCSVNGSATVSKFVVK